jgi:biopolymer transport protein ExbD
MAFRRRKRRRLDPAALRLPLIALIDVVLFLLMYFMVAGTLGSEERELSTTLGVDRGSGGGAASGLLPTILRVDKAERGDGPAFRLGDRVLKSQTALTELLAALPKESGVVIKSGEGVTVGDVAAALQACKDAGFAKISFLAN